MKRPVLPTPLRAEAATPQEKTHATPYVTPSHPQTPAIRVWWDDFATFTDQQAVLWHLKLSPGLAGVPWAFLPEDVQATLTRRVNVDWTQVVGAPKPLPAAHTRPERPFHDV